MRAIVTGANRGIGLEFVRQLLARGDRVVAGVRRPTAGDALHALAAAQPDALHVLPLDVGAPESIAAFAERAGALLDGIDLLVNNAGILHRDERFGDIGAAAFEDSFRINAMGPFLLTQALAPRLARGGCVVNMSSRLGAMALKDGFLTPTYSVSKAALNMVSVLLAHALADAGVRVFPVSPGWVRTDMGGTTAEVDPRDAVAGLLRLAAEAPQEDSGRFRDWTGAAIDW
ncbi:SDR family oxidoreductase [Coralloluteibacterium thermophilus]|uniref:SDR family oxidoreductase n=1 Tax=Coralloluteibacterium thermophilum TaxID=2707049 RepID=A0ABV9NLI4_9GAMM